MKKMTIVRRGLWVLFVMATLHGVAQNDSGTKLTLKECVDLALKNNLDVQRAANQAEAAGVNHKQAKNNVLPLVSANLGHGLNQGRSIDPFSNAYLNQQVKFANAGFNSSIILFNGGLLNGSIQQSRLAAEAANMETAQTKETVTLNVILAYLQILNNQDLVAQSINQAEVTRRQADRLEILNKAGAIVPALYYDLKGQLANDELAIVANRNALNNARLTLAQLMNLPYDATLTVVPITNSDLSPTYTADPAGIYEVASKQLPIIKAAAYRRQAAEKSIRVAKSNYYPTVSFTSGLNTNYSNAARMETVVSVVDAPSGDFVSINGSKVPVITQNRVTTQQPIGYFSQFNNNYSTSFFLNLTIPILNGFRAKNRVTLARIDEKNAAFIEQSTKTQLSQSIEQAYFNLTAAIERYNTLTRQVTDFAESFRIAEVRFNAGAITQVDYLVAKNNVDRTRTNLIIAKYDYAFRVKILDYYKGQLQL